MNKALNWLGALACVGLVWSGYRSRSVSDRFAAKSYTFFRGREYLVTVKASPSDEERLKHALDGEDWFTWHSAGGGNGKATISISVNMNASVTDLAGFQILSVR